MYTINSFSISKLNNAEVTGFYINVQKAVSTSDQTKLGLTEVMPSFNTTLQKLIDQVYTTTGSEFTAAMLEADVKRDQTFKRIRLRLQMVDVAEDNPAIKAVKDVVKAHLLAKYTSKVPQLPYQEESAILQGFLYDLDDKLGSDGMAALGITDDAAALEEANNTFISAYNARATERAEGDTGLTLKLRQEMYALYQQICYSVLFLANSTQTENAEKAAACQAFIAVLNVLLADAKKRYNQRINNNGTDEEGEGEGGDTNPDDSSDTIPDDGDDEGEGHTDSSDSTDNGGSNGGSNSGSDNGGSNSGNSSGSNSSNPSNPSNSSEGGNTDDPNKPSEDGVISDGGIMF